MTPKIEIRPFAEKPEDQPGTPPASAKVYRRTTRARQPVVGAKTVTEKSIDDALGKLIRTTGERWMTLGRVRSKNYEKIRNLLGEITRTIAEWKEES